MDVVEEWVTLKKIVTLYMTFLLVHHLGDVLLTYCCYLINQMPSYLNNQVPYSIVFSNEPRFPISHCVFGCACFVHDVSSGLNKLSV